MSVRRDVQQVAQRVRAELSRRDEERLDLVVGLIDDEGKANLAKVLEALYPGLEREKALTALRKFREAIGEAAEACEVRFGLETDGRTRTAPEEREVSFRAQSAGILVGEVAGADVGRVAAEGIELAVEKPLVRCFVSWAHEDKTLKDKLLKRTLHLLATHKRLTFRVWQDIGIPAGALWLAKLRQEMMACDFGLLFVSPAFLASQFIKTEELPLLMREKKIIPVALEAIQHGGDMDLQGLDEHQFVYLNGRPFSKQAGRTAQGEFAKELFERICLRLEEPEPKPEPKRESVEDQALRAAEMGFNELLFARPRGAQTTQEKLADPEAAQREDAIEFFLRWVQDPDAPPYCALLGEYGMGKTTTCKALALEVFRRRKDGAKLPVPVYLDLRHIGRAAKRGLELTEILGLALKQVWRNGPDDEGTTAAEIIGQVKKDEGALVIWDGLDEVLVHLDMQEGQQFTRQLYRILPPAARGEKKAQPSRLLISCRTHYFRTLREQKTHFLTEDRDGVRVESYRAFLLLPFTEEQIREYIGHSLPEENPDRVMETLGAVHNLREMAERPYTLSLIAERFRDIEKWKAEGRRVTGLTLYRHLALSWLERDTGKHQFLPDHKHALMEYVAAELWRSGDRFWPVARMDQWLVEFVEAHAEVRAHYPDYARRAELFKEDLRTATFLVREGEDRFRFAHTSLQEYFLAGYLRRALVEGRPEDWGMARPSLETLDFLGQWLVDDESQELRREVYAARRTLERLRDEYRRGASELAFGFFLLAKKKGYPCPVAARFQLPGADLFGWEVMGSEGDRLNLAGANLAGARVANGVWRYCNLDSAVFDGADAERAEFLGCFMDASGWKGARLEAGLFRECGLRGARLEGAVCNRTEFLWCEGGVAVEGAAIAPSVRKRAAQLTTGRGHRRGVEACAWSPDGQRLLSASSDNTLRVWDAASGRSLLILPGHQNSVKACAWSPDGQGLLSASDDHTLRVWDASSGQSLLTLAGHQDWVWACAWSPDGQRLLSASVDHTLRVWDACSGQSLLTLTGHQKGVLSCAWSPDGQRLLSASSDNTLRVWDASSGQSLLTLAGHQKGVLSCAWSPDGQRLLSASVDNTLRIWDASSGQSLLTLAGHRSLVWACAWSPDGQRLLSASDDHTLRVWDAPSGQSLLTLRGHQSPVHACAWSPDGRKLLSASDDHTLRVWDASSGQSLLTLTGDQSSVSPCAWSPDGRRLVSASHNETLRVWDASSGQSLLTLTGHQSFVSACAWSPDGQKLLSASVDNTLRVWDASSGQSLLTLASHRSFVKACAWSPNGQRLLSASDDHTLRVWDASSGQSLLTLTGHQFSVQACAWSPDGRKLLSASDDKALRVWDASSGQSLLTLAGHRFAVWACAWSPDGQRLLSASVDQTLRVWDASSGQSLLTLAGHQSFVSACAWSPDGRRLLSASGDQTLRVWDASSGQSLLTLAGHQDLVLACAWSPDGLRILSASEDGTIRIWDAVTGEEIGPTIYHLRAPRGVPTWAAVDHAANRVVACGPDAWRSLGWVVSGADGMPEWLPAETFGALPCLPR